MVARADERWGLGGAAVKGGSRESFVVMASATLAVVTRDSRGYSLQEPRTHAVPMPAVARAF